MSSFDYESLSPEEKAAYKESLFDSSKEKKDKLIDVELPDPLWKLIPAILGMPVEKKQRNVRHPLIIISFISLMFIIFLFSHLAGLKYTAETWGFTPFFWSRRFFTTLISSFFLHASWMHLIGNCYYFYIFGDDVEDDLGFAPFLKLLLGSHIAGTILFGIFNSTSTIPLVGASAGISGLLGYYMIRFPKRQLSYMLMFLLYSAVWLHAPAAFAFAWKLVMEFISAGFSSGHSHVAYLAHIGGMLFGVGFALFRRHETA